MPRGDPFTALCRQAASLARRVVADLHLHTTASDGDFTPSQVVAFARAAKLDAIAVTDHDTFAGVGDAIVVEDDRHFALAGPERLQHFLRNCLTAECGNHGQGCTRLENGLHR